MDKEILIATKNKGKATEFQELFNKYGFKVKTLLDFEEDIDVVEDGQTFRENAIKKAEEISTRFDIITLADDSGLIVDALNGKPGVYSARYAGEAKNDEANVNKVLEELKNIEQKSRTARFHCSLALAIPGKETITVDGTCEGLITEIPVGNNGFGYDPIFYIPKLGKTMAQLSKTEKNEISHRAMALKKLQELLPTFL